MRKLDERDASSATPPLASAPSIAVQFFLIPLAVVGVIVLVYGGFRMLVSNERTPEEFLHDVRVGGRDRRWPAAYELSRLLADPKVQTEHPGLGPAIVQAFTDSVGDDPRVRRYLALAIGRLESLPPGAVDALLVALDDPDSETCISVIWALAAIGDPTVVDDVEGMYLSDDAGVRKMAVYALGVLPPDDRAATLRNALDDNAPDVRWNAAVALARHGRDEGLAVIGRMLDREYVERNVRRTQTTDSTVDPIASVMMSGLQAVGSLRASVLRSEVEELSRTDVSLRVREVALRTVELLGSSRAELRGAQRRN